MAREVDGRMFWAFKHVFHRVIPKVLPGSPGWREVSEWLQDNARPGVYTVIETFQQDEQSNLVKRDFEGVFIEDRDTAFEFKLRFG